MNIKIAVLFVLFSQGCSVGTFDMEQDPFSREVPKPAQKTDIEKEADYAKKNHGIISIHRHGPGYDVMMMLNAGESDIIFSMDLPPGGETFMPEVSKQLQSRKDSNSMEGGESEKEPEFFNKKALSLFSDATKHMLSAQALFYRKSYWKALEKTNKAISLVPASAQAYALKGSIYYKLGRKKEAKKSWQKAFKLDPSLTDVKESLKLVK